MSNISKFCGSLKNKIAVVIKIFYSVYRDYNEIMKKILQNIFLNETLFVTFVKTFTNDES